MRTCIGEKGEEYPSFSSAGSVPSSKGRKDNESQKSLRPRIHIRCGGCATRSRKPHPQAWQIIEKNKGMKPACSATMGPESAEVARPGTRPSKPLVISGDGPEHKKRPPADNEKRNPPSKQNTRSRRFSQKGQTGEKKNLFSSCSEYQKRVVGKQKLNRHAYRAPESRIASLRHPRPAS